MQPRMMPARTPTDLRPHERPVVAIRSMFISDLHLGARHARPEVVLRLLKEFQPTQLYLVGDIIDGRSLQRRWHWPAACAQVLDQLAHMSETGTELFYTPGNHDAYLRNHLTSDPPLQVQDQFVHHCADGRRLLITHGDQFDDVEEKAQWLSRVGSVGYDLLITVDRTVNRGWKYVSLRPLRISRFAKQTAKKWVQWASGFEARVVNHARAHGCDGIVCGHIHVPRVRQFGDILYVNLGDWVENATALIEYDSGELELLNLDRLANPTGGQTEPPWQPRRHNHVADRLTHPLAGQADSVS